MSDHRLRELERTAALGCPHARGAFYAAAIRSAQERPRAAIQRIVADGWVYLGADCAYQVLIDPNSANRAIKLPTEPTWFVVTNLANEDSGWIVFIDTADHDRIGQIDPGQSVTCYLEKPGGVWFTGG